MLPSKKILIMLALLIVGIGALAFYGYNRESSTEYTNPSGQNYLTVASSSDEFAAVSKIDSDGDGLPDWEEALYGTDPKIADTDKDGTSDSKEVELGRNPLVKGPKDFLSQNNNPVATSTTAEKLTLTDSFARDIFAQYVNTQQTGTKITADNADQFASQYLSKTTLPNVLAKQYLQTDLILVDANQTTIKNYQDSISAIFEKNWPSGKVNELAIMQQAFANNDTKTLIGLAPIISSYQKILNGSVSLAIPKTASQLHLNIINSLATYIQTLKMIQLTDTDPLGGLAGLNAYQNNYSNLWMSITNLKMYFINSLK